LEFDPDVAEYVEQPLTIRYTEDGKIRRYTPDFFVRYTTGEPALLLEIKYAEDLRVNQVKFAPRFQAAEEHAGAQGWEFHVWTEAEIRTPYLKNVKFLLRFRSATTVVRADYCQLLLVLVTQLERTTPAEVLAAAFQNPQQQAELLPVLWYLVSTGQLGCDLSAALTMRSSLWNIHIQPTLHHG